MQSMYVLRDIMKNALFSTANVRFLGVANVSHSPTHISFYRLFLICCLHICKKKKRKTVATFILNVTHHWKCHRLGLTWKLPIRVKSWMLHMENFLGTPISPAVINLAFSLHIKWAFLDLWYLITTRFNIITITHCLFTITKIKDHRNKNDQFLSILIL